MNDKTNNSSIEEISKCSNCGEDLIYSTFLSDTFGFHGGVMVFTCKCGENFTRDFIPIDNLPELQQMKYLMKRAGVEDSIIDVAISHLKVERGLAKITNKVRT